MALPRVLLEPNVMTTVHHDAEKEHYTKLRVRAESLLKDWDKQKGDAAGPEPQWLEEIKLLYVEMDLQNDELRQAVTQLEDAKEKYFRIFDLSPLGYVVLDMRGLILEANLKACEMLGIDRRRLSGGTIVLTGLLEGLSQQTFLECLRKFHEGDDVSRCVVRTLEGRGWSGAMEMAIQRLRRHAKQRSGACLACLHHPERGISFANT